jgi:hypothetical protein
MKHRVLLAVCLVFVFLTASTPRQALAQVPTVEQLTARVAELDRRVAELEHRLRILEGPTARPENPAVRGNWRDIANWRKLQAGMTMDQVSDLLGPPEKVVASGPMALWYFGKGGGGNVTFMSNKLNGWSEPSR